MNRNKTMLITGASGFLGTYLAEKAFSEGYNLIGVDIQVPFKTDIWTSFATASCESVDYELLLDGKVLDAVCHLAGGASVASSVTNPYSDFMSLMPGTAKLVLYLAKAQPQAKIYFFSSAAVYGNPKILPIVETTPILPISAYGIHKAIAESLLIHYARNYELNITIFRIFSVYGPGLRKQLIWDVCLKALKAKEMGERSIKLKGTGLESRDFIYVKDLCKAVMIIVNQNDEAPIKIYNIGSGRENTINEIATLIIENLDLNIDVEFDGILNTGNPLNWRTDIKNISQKGYTSDYSINEGIKEVTEWVTSIYS